MSMRRTYRAVPTNPDGYPINADREWFSVVIPEATMNLFTNPSWETNTTGWTLTGTATYARTATYQCRGAYCAYITVTSANTAARIVGPAVVSGTLYTMSFHVRRAGRAPIKPTEIAAYVNGAAIAFDALEYIADGWWRAIKTFQATATTAPGIQFTAALASDVLYVDAAQLEAKGYVTTYCDGDQLGLLPIGLEPTPYAWTGASHASTSTRSAATRAGGREMRLDRYGFTLLSMIGLGASKRVNIATPLGLIDGSFYQTTIREARTFSLVGSFEASNPYTLSKNQAALRAAIQHDSTGYAQPLLLTAQRFDGTTALGAKGQIIASYADGLDGNVTQLANQRASISFEQQQPGIASIASLSVSSPSALYITTNYALSFYDGTWSTMAGGTNGTVYCSAIAPNGNLYIGGSFTTAGGVTVNNIAMWDGTAWNALGSGTSGTVYALCFLPDGTLYVGGTFATANGVTANNFAKYSEGTWSALGTGTVGTNNTVYGIAYARGGEYIVIVGAFTTAGGAAHAYFALFVGTAFYGSTSFNGTCYCITPTHEQNVFYIGGAFTTVSGVSCNNIVKYTFINAVEQIYALMVGLNNPCYAIVVSTNNTLYAGGTFTTAGGVSARFVAMWNGNTWSAMGRPFASGTQVRALAYDPVYNKVYAGGDINVSDVIFGLLVSKTPLAVWDGGVWKIVPLFPVGTSIVIYTITNADSLFIGSSSSFSWYNNSTATITNRGSVPVPVECVIRTTGNPTVVVGFVNYSTNKAIYVAPFIIYNAQEIITIRYISGAIFVISSINGVLSGVVLPYSDPGALLIRPGNNIVSVLVTGNASSVISDIVYTPLFDDLDGLTGK